MSEYLRDAIEAYNKTHDPEDGLAEMNPYCAGGKHEIHKFLTETCGFDRVRFYNEYGTTAVEAYRFDKDGDTCVVDYNFG